MAPVLRYCIIQGGINMIIKEARSTSYAKWRDFDNAAVKVSNEIKRLNKESEIRGR